VASWGGEDDFDEVVVVDGVGGGRPFDGFDELTASWLQGVFGGDFALEDGEVDDFVGADAVAGGVDGGLVVR